MNILTAVSYATAPTFRNFTCEPLQFTPPDPTQSDPRFTRIVASELERASAAYHAWITGLEEEIEHIEGIHAAYANDQEGQLYILVSAETNASWDALTHQITLAIFGDTPSCIDVRTTDDNPYLVLYHQAACA